MKFKSMIFNLFLSNICIYLLMTLTTPNTLLADPICKGHFVNPITDICWGCLFPISLGRIPVVPSGLDLPDTDNPALPICYCQRGMVPQIGISFGFWEPFAMADVTRDPFCMVNLGFKIDVGSMSHDIGSTDAHQMGEDQGGFYWVHWYKYPLVYWLQIITSTACMQVGDFDIAYLTELDPLWNDDQLSFVLNPEAILFGNTVTQSACAADALKTSTGHSMPIDALFWCMGSQGSSYPLTGNVANDQTNIQTATLLAERMNFKMHREGLAWDTSGEDGQALCYEHPSLILPKSRYRYQMVNTVPDGTNCHPYGQMTQVWESGHDNFLDKENYGFLMWRKRNCCFL